MIEWLLATHPIHGWLWVLFSLLAMFGSWKLSKDVLVPLVFPPKKKRC